MEVATTSEGTCKFRVNLRTADANGYYENIFCERDREAMEKNLIKNLVKGWNEP